MGVDLPPVTSSDIQSELNKPQKAEVISIGECRENLDFQNQFDNLVSNSKNETNDLKNELQEYTQSQKETAFNGIYCCFLVLIPGNGRVLGTRLELRLKNLRGI